MRAGELCGSGTTHAAAIIDNLATGRRVKNRVPPRRVTFIEGSITDSICSQRLSQAQNGIPAIPSAPPLASNEAT